MTAKRVSDTQRRTRSKGGRSQKAAQQAVSAKMAARVAELRCQGYNFRRIEEITEAEGERIPRATACDLWRRELAKLKEETKGSVEDYRDESIAKLQDVQATVRLQIAIGDMRAAAVFVKAEEQINKLRGTFAPVKLDLKDERFRALTDDALHTELQRGASALGYTLVPAG